jgi:hypothetical protein
MVKGGLAREMEVALKLYIEKYLAEEAPAPLMAMIQRLDSDGQLVKYLEDSGMSIFDLVLSAVSMFLELPEESRKIIKISAAREQYQDWRNFHTNRYKNLITGAHKLFPLAPGGIFEHFIESGIASQRSSHCRVKAVLCLLLF